MRRVIIGLLAIALVVIVAAVIMAGRGIGAVDHRPWPLEARIARASWRFLVPSAIRVAANPVPATTMELKVAREHFADHCAVCHDNDGSGDTTIGHRVYPPPPDLRSRRTQDLTDGELFYAIERGIPWTAMPGWTTRSADGERESWALVRFIRHLPDITSDELRQMESLNPKPPTNEEREKDIEDFLSGRGTGRRGGSVP